MSNQVKPEATEKPSTVEMLEDAYAHLDVLKLKKAEIIKKVIPAEVQEQLDAIEAEFASQIAAVEEAIDNLEYSVKEEAVAARETIEAGSFQVVFTRGGYSVKPDDVLRVADRWEKINAEVAAELRSILTVKKSSASIRARK
jgi:hypothetical protein